MENKTDKAGSADTRANLGQTSKSWRSWNWKIISWVCGIAVLSLIWLDFWLTLANVKFLLDCIPVEPLGEGSQSAAVTAAATGLAGFIGLLTFLLSRDQKEDHQVRNERDVRDLAELQRLESQFSQLAKDFSASSVLENVSAAIGFAELALQPDPRDTDIGTFELKFGLNASRKQSQKYPFYIRATRRLTSALVLWESDWARDEAVTSLIRMAKWAKDPGSNEPLLHDLINLIAKANAALRTSIDKAAAEYVLISFGVGKSPFPSQILKILENFAKTLDPPEVVYYFDQETIQAVHKLVLSYNGVYQVRDTKSEVLQAELALRCRQLIQTRFCLEQCLSLLSELPNLESNLFTPDEVHLFRKWRDLDLRHTSLVGIQLNNCSLAFAQLEFSDLTLAGISGSNFFGANLEASRMSKSSIYESSFDCSCLASCIFENCKVSYSSFLRCRGAFVSFRSSEVRKSRFDCSNFEWFMYDSAKFTKCSFRDIIAGSWAPDSECFTECDFAGLKKQ